MSDLLTTQLWRCGECDAVATDDAWNAAWWRKRSALTLDPEVRTEAADEERLGSHIDTLWAAVERRMADSMVCPACGYHHRDDENSFVSDLVGEVARETVRER